MIQSKPVSLDGALLIDKPADITSFGVIDALKKPLKEQLGLKKWKDLPKLGHGGTLDPFATGLMVVLVGRASKLAKYILGSDKTYRGTLHFGETTVPGDPTEPVSQRSDRLPSSLEEMRDEAREMTGGPYFQIPPMHSAKKIQGKKLYELAREGKEIEREAKEVRLLEFNILEYQAPDARFEVTCTAGTYIRVLAQDLAKRLGTVGMLNSLSRTASGKFKLEAALSLNQILDATRAGTLWTDLSCWIPYDGILTSGGVPRLDATAEETQALRIGKKAVFFSILRRAGANVPIASRYLSVYFKDRLIAVAARNGTHWELDRILIS